MITLEKIEEIRLQTAHAIIDQREFEREQREPVTLTWLLNQIPAWKRWYLKRNQPHNYLRVTRIIPAGAEENRHRWLQKIQCWVKGTIEFEYPIDADTFDHFYSIWEQGHMKDMNYAVYRTPAQLETLSLP